MFADGDAKPNEDPTKSESVQTHWKMDWLPDPCCESPWGPIIMLSHIVLACVEAWLVRSRFTDTTFPEAVVVANAWRAWVIYMCVFHFICFVAATCCVCNRFSRGGQKKTVSFFLCPVAFITDKLCKSDGLTKVATSIWGVTLWYTMPVLTWLFWFPSPQGTWMPGCVPFARLCDPTLWRALRVTNVNDFNVMVNQYGKPQKLDCPIDGKMAKDEECDPYFGLGFVGFVVTFEVIYAGVSIAWPVLSLMIRCGCCGKQEARAPLIGGGSRSTPMNDRGANRQPDISKIQVAALVMVRRYPSHPTLWIGAHAE
jgi:hypothetical protein